LHCLAYTDIMHAMSRLILLFSAVNGFCRLFPSCWWGDTMVNGWCARQQQQAAAYEQRLYVDIDSDEWTSSNQPNGVVHEFSTMTLGRDVCGQHNRWCVLVGVFGGAFSWLRKEQSNLKTNPFNVPPSFARHVQDNLREAPPNEYTVKLVWNFTWI